MTATKGLKSEPDKKLSKLTRENGEVRVMKRTLYMHTLNGEPAAVCEAYDPPSLCYAGKAIRTSEMAANLRELRIQQSRVRPPLDGDRHSYIRVVVDR